MIIFHAPDIAATHQLPEGESGHCIRVLRHVDGDEITAVDGRGTSYRCRITDAHPKHTAVDILQATPCPPVWDYPITLLIAPTKLNDRMEWMVEKLVENGIDRIIPVKCRHSERKDIKPQRLEKIAVSAMKQSLKATLPVIEPMMPLDKALALTDARQRFVGYCDDNTPRMPLARACRPGLSTAIAIGPEGDFSPDEITLLKDHGFVPVTMGDNRLRTETAALTAVTTVHVVNQLTQHPA